MVGFVAADGLSEHLIGGDAVENIIPYLERVADRLAVFACRPDGLVVGACRDAAQLARRLEQTRGLLAISSMMTS